MTEDKAQKLADLFEELARDVALRAVFEHEGDYDTYGDRRGIKERIVAALRESEG